MEEARPEGQREQGVPPARAPATLCTVSDAGYRHVPVQSREQRLRICAYRRCDGRGGAGWGLNSSLSVVVLFNGVSGL